VQQWSANWRDGSNSVRQTGFVEADAGDRLGEQGAAAPEVIPTPEAVAPEAIRPAPVPAEARMFAPQFAEPAGQYGSGEPYGPWDGPCGECGPCGGGPCDDRCGPRCDGQRDCLFDWLSNFTVFMGVQGFKGPVDIRQNGNFGFHEGLNFGGPLGDPWGCGFQLGFQGVQSNLAGFQANNSTVDASGRDQVFFTGGIFHRPEGGGLQSGVVFDYMHDSYYATTDLRQIRSENAIVFGNGMSEIGYWGAYGINRERFRIPTSPSDIVLLQPNDIFAGFYRRHFTGGGQGRLWAGATGVGQAIIGGEATVPLGTSWALENNFAYVIPKSSPTNGGQREETWSVTINLVWYPGRPARTVFQNPFHPLFGVGDNSAFLVRR
jgi:hypothetical protein